MNTNDYSYRLSSAINWLRFPLIFLIILLHCYSVVQVTGPASSIYFKTVYPFALWLGETGVPAFFFISGFLFFFSQKSYREKLTTRIRTLLVPYLLWNTLLLAVYLLAYGCGLPVEVNGKAFSSFDAMDYLRLYWDKGSYDNGNSTPLLCPFWYIRNLLVMTVLSPVVYYLLRYLREFFLLAVLIWWLLTPHNAFTSQTVLFFSLGAYFSIFKTNFLSMVIAHRKLFLSAFVLLAILDIGSHTLYTTPVNLQLHRLSLIANIPILFLLADACSRRNLSSSFLTNAAFITFALHYPIVLVIRKGSLLLFANASAMGHILLYIASILLTFLLCVLCSRVLDKYLNPLKKLLSGSR